MKWKGFRPAYMIRQELQLTSLAVADTSKGIKCKQGHEQLAEWLEELKSYRASVFS